MKKKHKLLLLISIILVLSSCNGTRVKNVNSSASHPVEKTVLYDKYKADPSIVKWLEKNKALCENFLDGNKKPYIEEKIVKCFSKALFEQSYFLYHAPQNLVDQLFERLISFNASSGTLTKVLEVVAYHHAANSKLIELLIKEGAQTNNLTLKLVREGNSSACKTSMLILKNNKNIYKQKLSIGNYLPSVTALHHQVDASGNRLVCPDVAKLLIEYNDRALNAQDHDGNTPLHYLLLDFSAAGRNTELAKILMTKENVNMQTSDGNTPLHGLLMYNSPHKADMLIVKTIVVLGGNLALKNKQGKTVRDIIHKRPDLVSILEIK